MTPNTLNKAMFKRIRKIISITILVAFISTSVKSPAYAQFASVDQMPFMPKPGVMVHLSPEYTPAYLKGIVIHPENALKFDFIVYKGDTELTDAQKRIEYAKLTKYFLASLAIPDDDQWVNLSPYEKDRIIKDDFGKTEMGRDLLAQDYMLKQITASLIYPEDNLGKKFWDKVYTEAQEQYGTTNIPVNTFNKVWILPDDALIYEKGNTAYVLKNHLRVMLEEDYLSLQKHSGIQSVPTDNKIHSIASKIVKEIVLPELEREVNEDQNFATVRQVYSGMLLAAWYKRALKESFLSKIYANRGKVKGVDQDPATNEQIYRQYLKAYKKGVFNFIKEDVDKYTNETIPRKYFSGGAGSYSASQAMLHTDPIHIIRSIDPAQAAFVSTEVQDNKDDLVQIAAEEKLVADQETQLASAAMTGNKKGFLTTESLYQKSELSRSRSTRALTVAQLQGTRIQLTTEEIVYYTQYVQALRKAGNLQRASMVEKLLREAGLTKIVQTLEEEYGVRLTGPEQEIIDELTAHAISQGKAEEEFLLSDQGFLNPNQVHRLLGTAVASYNNRGEANAAMTIEEQDFWDNVAMPFLRRDKDFEITAISGWLTHHSSNFGLLEQATVDRLFEEYETNPKTNSNVKVVLGYLMYEGFPIVFEPNNLRRIFTILEPSYQDYLIELVNDGLLHNRKLDFPTINAVVSSYGLQNAAMTTGFVKGMQTRIDNFLRRQGYQGAQVKLTFSKNVQARDGFVLTSFVQGEQGPFLGISIGLNVDDFALSQFIGGKLALDRMQQVDLTSILDRYAAKSTVSAAMNSTKGGIDFNAANLNLRIKRDGQGVPLPLSQQDMSSLSNLEGLEPVILSIRPAATSLPFFSQLQSNSP